MPLPSHHLDPAGFAERGIVPEQVFCYRDAHGNPVGAVARSGADVRSELPSIRRSQIHAQRGNTP